MADFLYSIPRDVLIHLLRSESGKRGYSDAGARVSLLMDIDAGKPRSRNEYARIWGWKPKYIRLRWDDLLADVVEWATSAGRQSDSEIGRRALDYAEKQKALSETLSNRLSQRAQKGHRLGHRKGTENAPGGGNNADQGHRKGTGRAQKGHTYYTNPTTLHDDVVDEDARAREADDGSTSPVTWKDDEERGLMQAQLAETLAAWPHATLVDRLYVAVVLRDHRQQVPRTWLIEQAKRMPWPDFVLSVLYAASWKGNPQKYLARILDARVRLIDAARRGVPDVEGRIAPAATPSNVRPLRGPAPERAERHISPELAARFAR